MSNNREKERQKEPILTFFLFLKRGATPKITTKSMIYNLLHWPEKRQFEYTFADPRTPFFRIYDYETPTFLLG